MEKEWIKNSWEVLKFLSCTCLLVVVNQGTIFSYKHEIKIFASDSKCTVKWKKSGMYSLSASFWLSLHKEHFPLKSI